MSKDFEKKAHDGGGHDSKESRGRNSTADIISDQLFGGKYNSPSGHEEAYKKGWENDQKQSK